jgi:hypothetical protein
MEFAVVHSPQRHDELVVSAAKRTWQSEVVSIGRAPAAEIRQVANRQIGDAPYRVSERVSEMVLPIRHPQLHPLGTKFDANKWGGFNAR